MPLETLDRSPPPFFKQGPSALSQLVFFSALALFLMVADARFQIVQPLRAVIATVLYPAQWLALQPVQMVQTGLGYLTDLKTARVTEEAARVKLAEQSQRAGQVEQLLLENERLRQLLGLRERLQVASVAAQVLYDATDPYSRRVVIGKGQLQGIEPGSPVMDESGVLGQVTRVLPFVSEVTLLVDRDQAIPTEVSRTGVRGVMYGLASNLTSDTVELRYMPRDSDVQPGDALVTSGLDGIYPPGLPVAVVTAVERQGATAFLRIDSQPLAKMQGTRHVLVLTPRNSVLAAERPIAQELATLSQSNADAKKKARDDKSAQRRATPAAPPGQERQP